MNNEVHSNKSWINTNRKWIFLISILGLLIFFWIIIKSAIDGNVADYAKAYSDKTLYINALEKVKANPKAVEILGEINPIDELAILEGEVKYSNKGNSVESSIRIKGKKNKAKMDIVADKFDNQWIYKKINLRIKTTKEIIKIL
jgi:predicted negative regulator of RcsB-dependent stress response